MALSKDIRHTIRVQLSAEQALRLNIIMYMKMLGKHTVDWLDKLLIAENAAQKRALLAMDLPFRLSFIHDGAKHSKFVLKGTADLSLLLFPEYEKLLNSQQPFQLMVGVRYKHAQAASFLESLQQTIHDQDPQHPLNLSNDNMFFLSFA